MIALAVLSVVVAYLLGSISFAVVFSKLFSHVDVRSQGSGNAGTTNVLRVSGVKAGVLTLVCDALKGTASCLIGMFAFKAAFGADNTVAYIYGEYLCALFCMLGHAFPIYFGFKGGKCAATSVGIFAVCCPLGIILGLIGWGISMAISRIVSLSTLIATVIVVATSVILNGIINFGVNPIIIVLTLAMGAVVVLRHKDNIIRLIRGEEKKLKVKKS